MLSWIDSRSVETGAWIGANDRDVDDLWSWGIGNARVPFFQDDSSGGYKLDENVFVYWGQNRPNGDVAMDPDEDCAHYDPVVDWRWNDRGCSNPLPAFLCEQVD